MSMRSHAGQQQLHQFEWKWSSVRLNGTEQWSGTSQLRSPRTPAAAALDRGREAPRGAAIGLPACVPAGQPERCTHRQYTPGPAGSTSRPQTPPAGTAAPWQVRPEALPAVLEGSTGTPQRYPNLRHRCAGRGLVPGTCAVPPAWRKLTGRPARGAARRRPAKRWETFANAAVVVQQKFGWQQAAAIGFLLARTTRQAAKAQPARARHASHTWWEREAACRERAPHVQRSASAHLQQHEQQQ